MVNDDKGHDFPSDWQYLQKKITKWNSDLANGMRSASSSLHTTWLSEVKCPI